MKTLTQNAIEAGDGEMRISCFPSAFLLVLALTSLNAWAADIPRTLPNWRLELVAAAPAVKHPSVVCAAPDGRVFVAEDPMDITAAADATFGRILCLHPDGHWTVFATNLHAVFGLQYLEGKLYVLHNPKFTVFTDDHGRGQDRVDLIEQTNPNPWALDWNDHIPANFRLAMDGYFYVAIGDKGLYHCQGRDGSEVNLHGGGILRLRPDGTELEVYCAGVRNILDVALDPEDELFTYDNTDEYQWMGRLTHMVDGGFYGYPHDFIPRRPYTLWMMHDFGPGAACGALAYNEDALPIEFRGDLFLADFGKRQVIRARIQRDGGTFRFLMSEELFHDQPEDFRPVGIALSPDALGLYICDWQHRDVKDKEASVGRLWRLSWTGPTHAAPKPAWYLPLALGQSANVPAADLIGALSHPSHSVRLTAQRALVRGVRREKGSPKKLMALLHDASVPAVARWHALWTLDLMDGGRAARKDIFAAATDADASVARQAIRQLGARRVREAVPLLTRLLRRSDPSIRFQAATALGRIADTNAIPALLAALSDSDFFARYAAFTALNRIGRAHPDAWPAVVAGLASESERVREGTAFALRETFDAGLVAALNTVDRSSRNEKSAPDLAARGAALKALAALHHQPPEWRGEWWAYHPANAPAPERAVAWAGTTAILETLRAALADHDARVRLTAVEGLGEARDTNAALRLRDRFTQDPNPAVRRAALHALGAIRDPDTAPLVATAVRNRDTDSALLFEAVELAPKWKSPEVSAALIELFKRIAAPPALRLAAIDALARSGGADAAAALRDALKSANIEERRAAIRALGKLRDKAAVSDLLAAWASPATRAEALGALTRFSDPRALDAYLDGLASADPVVREQCRKALAPIRAETLPEIETRGASFSAPVLAELRRIYANDPEALRKPLFASGAKMLEAGDYEGYALAHAGIAEKGERIFFNEQGVACSRCHSVEGRGGGIGPDLTMAGAQFSRAQVIESVLYPSRAVREGYQQIVVETKDEESLSGVLKAETADGLTLVDAGGRTNFVARASVVNRRASELSLMPEGLQVGLTLDEFADLIAYLESRKADARSKSP